MCCVPSGVAPSAPAGLRVGRPVKHAGLAGWSTRQAFAVHGSRRASFFSTPHAFRFLDFCILMSRDVVIVPGCDGWKSRGRFSPLPSEKWLIESIQTPNIRRFSEEKKIFRVIWRHFNSLMLNSTSHFSLGTFTEERRGMCPMNLPSTRPGGRALEVRKLHSGGETESEKMEKTANWLTTQF